ncbi:hypothetical protein [Spiroplasma endosymbiont of Aspidapion aeneum]|uniref:hypothetical protein n=1 Tax=Spiroplasma endosymbiont of Aspidapion aeneum TaxID=3066276 RepID=UPI00313C36DD
MNNISDIDLKVIFDALNNNWRKFQSSLVHGNFLNTIKKNLEIETNYDKRITGYNIDDIIFDKIVDLDSKLSVDILYSLCEKKSKNWIVGIHTFTGCKEKMLHNLLFYKKFGFNILLFDLRGHKLTDNNICTFGVKEIIDLEVVLKWLKSKFKPKQVGIHGIDIGAYIANKFILLNKNDIYNLEFVISDSTYYSYYKFIKKLIFKMANNDIPKNHKKNFDFVTDEYLRYCKEKHNINISDTSISRTLENTKSTVPTLFFSSEYDDISLISESHEFMLNRIKFEKNDHFYDLCNKSHGMGFYEKTDEYIDAVREFFRINHLI